MRTKKHENLTQANINKVIELLNPTDGSKPITKKEACAILNIAYNTTRLGSIIAEHKDIMEYRATRKAQNRGRKATDLEKRDAIERYLNGQTVSEIAKGMFRSTTFIRNLIDNIGVPQKITKSEKSVYAWRTPMLPEQCVAEEFEVGEKIWAVRENYPAIVQRELTTPEQAEEKGFRVYLCYTIECTQEDLKDTYFPYLEFAGKYSCLAAYDMGSLRHLRKYM